MLDTARRLFAENGVDATSLQQIADAAGVQKANVYYYFRTKNAILEALLDERVTALDEMLDRAETVTGVDDRRELMIRGFVEQVVLAHRTIAPVDVADPGIRRHEAIARRLDALADRGLRLLFGDDPTVDEQAAFWMVNDLKPVTRRLTDLPDDELRGALYRLCLRIIPDRPPVTR